MNRGTWKAIERWWARQLGGSRVPITGRARGEVPDVISPRWAIEVKAGRVMPDRLRVGMSQAVLAAGDSRLPLLCVTHTNGRGRRREHYVIMRLADFQTLIGGEP